MNNDIRNRMLESLGIDPKFYSVVQMLSEVRVLSLDPGDILVFKTERVLSPDDAHMFKSYTKNLVESLGIKNRVIVANATHDIGVIKVNSNQPREKVNAED